MTFLELLGVLALFTALLGGLWFIHWADRKRIRRFITETKGEVIRVESLRPSMARRMLSEASTTCYRVTYRNAQGQIRVADCYASMVRCNVYKDVPIEDVYHPTCRACGYNLTGNTSGTCPECGAPAGPRGPTR